MHIVYWLVLRYISYFEYVLAENQKKCSRLLNVALSTLYCDVDDECKAKAAQLIGDCVTDNGRYMHFFILISKSQPEVNGR